MLKARHKRLYKVFAILFALVIAFGGCSKKEEAQEAIGDDEYSAEIPEEDIHFEDTGDEESSPRADEVRTDTLRIDTRNPKTYNPVLNEELSVDRLLRLMYEPLIAIDENLRPIPSLATGWEFVPDGTSLTLHLRTDAYWADGVPVSSEDVIYTLNTIRTSPETALYNRCLLNVISYEAIDPKTVKVNYSKAFSGALYNLTFPVAPAHHFMEIEKTPLGCGLYKLDAVDLMKKITLSASTNSFRGIPAIPKIEAMIIRDKDTGLYSFDQDMIDIVETSLADWKRITTTKLPKVTQIPSLKYEYLAINGAREIFKNPEMRKALSHAISKEDVADKCYAGNAFATNTPISPNSWLYEPNTELYQYDLEKAKDILVNINFQGAPLVILVNSENEERKAAAALIKDKLDSLGFSCQIESHYFEEYTELLRQGAFDLAVTGLDMSLYPNYTPLLSSVGDLNFSGYASAEMDVLLSQADAAIFEEAQKLAYSAVQKKFGTDIPHISLCYKSEIVLSGESISGEIRPVVNNAYNNIGEINIVKQVQ